MPQGAAIALPLIQPGPAQDNSGALSKQEFMLILQKLNPEITPEAAPPLPTHSGIALSLSHLSRCQ